MGSQIRIMGAALALTALLAQSAGAQDAPQDKKITLPPIDVSQSRLGDGIAGTSTSVITAEQIARSPGESLQDVIGREAGIQTWSTAGGINGATTTVDIRGFGAAGAGQAGIVYDPMRDTYGPASGGLTLPSLGGPPGLLINAIEALSRMFSEGVSPDAAHEPTQPNENNLDKIKGNKAADAAAVDAGYDSAHDAKYGRGNSSVDIYNDKTTGQKWLWDGKKGSGKEQL